MSSMSRVTGKLIDGPEEIEQAIGEIIGTFPGDRPMRADYGSKLFALTDTALNASGRSRVNTATVEAIRKWEPRVDIKNVAFSATPDGNVTQTLHGTIKATRQNIVVRR